MFVSIANRWLFCSFQIIWRRRSAIRTEKVDPLFWRCDCYYIMCSYEWIWSGLARRWNNCKYNWDRVSPFLSFYFHFLGLNLKKRCLFILWTYPSKFLLKIDPTLKLFLAFQLPINIKHAWNTQLLKTKIAEKKYLPTLYFWDCYRKQTFF